MRCDEKALPLCLPPKPTALSNHEKHHVSPSWEPFHRNWPTCLKTQVIENSDRLRNCHSIEGPGAMVTKCHGAWCPGWDPGTGKRHRGKQKLPE